MLRHIFSLSSFGGAQRRPEDRSTSRIVAQYEHPPTPILRTRLRLAEG
jgi:hypothetical protein